MKTKGIINRIKRFFSKNRYYIYSAVLSLLLIISVNIIIFSFPSNIILFLKNCDDDNIANTFIAILFTVLGFTITTRNLLIGRETSKFQNFSYKVIIANGSSCFCKVLWYVILMCPINGIILFCFGFRKRISTLVILSTLCMLVYFWTTLRRLRDEHCHTIIAEILIHSLVNNNDEIYRKDVINKICVIDSNNSSINNSIEIFRLFIDRMKEISERPYRHWNIFKSILYNINCKRLRSYKKTNYEKLIKEHKLTFNYAYDFCDRFIKENIEAREDFVVYSVTELLKKCNFMSESEIKINNFFDVEKTPRLTYLYFNIIFGIIMACFKNLSLKNNKKILEMYFQTLYMDRKFKISFLPNYINAIIVISINYLLNKNQIYSRNMCDELFDFYREKILKTKKENYDFLKKVLCISNSGIENTTEWTKIIESLCFYLPDYFMDIPLLFRSD